MLFPVIEDVAGNGTPSLFGWDPGDTPGVFLLDKSLLKADSFPSNERMFLEPAIIVGSIIKAILCAPAFFASQRRARDKRCRCVNVRGFAGPSRCRLGQTCFGCFQLLNGLSQTLARTNDSGLAPHELLNFLDERFYIRGWRLGVYSRALLIVTLQIRSASL